jgi:hypothetical protein
MAQSSNFEKKVAYKGDWVGGTPNTLYFHTRKLYYNLGKQVKKHGLYFCEKPEMSSSNSHSSIFSNSSVSSLCEIEVERVETEYFEASHGGHVDDNSDEEIKKRLPWMNRLLMKLG